MAKRHKVGKRKSWWARKKLLYVLAGAMISLGFYFFPFGYAEIFYWLQNNLFGGNYSDTTWFMYFWTSALVLGGLTIMVVVYKKNAKKILRSQI